MKKLNTTVRGELATTVLVVLGIAALGLFVAKPRMLDGDSKRAAASTEATAKLDAAVTQQGAEAAASVVKISEANSSAPESLERTFISKEVPVVLAKLPSPDPQALIEAEKRKVAVLERRLAETDKLYEKEMYRADQLAREHAEALKARKDADLRLEQAASLHLGMQRQRNQMFLALGILGVIIIYLKLTHLSPGAVADAVIDLRNKVHADPVSALDGPASRLQQRYINFLTRLKSK